MQGNHNSRPRPLTDQELAFLVKSGDRDAFSVLSGRYAAFLKGRAVRCSGLAGAEEEDFVQEGLLALYRAARCYDAKGRSGFRTYAFICINRSMSAAVKRHLKHSRQTSPLTLDQLESQELRGELAASGERPEQLFFDRESLRMRAHQIKTQLSHFERQVLRLYLRGYTYKRISMVLSTSTKSVDNALQRTRRKLRLFL